MCGRYSLREAPNTSTNPRWREYWRDLQLPPRYNIAPSQQAVTIRTIDGKPISDDALTWGFKPAWSTYKPAINAKAERVFESELFRDSARRRRCLVVADGFYEPMGPSTSKNRPILLRV